VNNYNYIVDAMADEPIMLLNREIGSDEGMVSGADFQEQLMYLDSLGKKRIQVWINCVGGSVVDGYNIYNAILKSNTPVDTYNVGICASMAGAIFMAGRKRIMSDYAKLMMHPVQGSDTKAYQSFMDSISEMISAKSNLSAEDVTNMMQSTTWLSAEECMAKNLCTSIEKTTDSNKKYLPNETNLLLEYSNKLIEDLFNNKKTNKKMIEVTNKLNLNADASEQSILDAINSLETAKNQAVTEKETLQNELAELQTKQTEIETKLSELEIEKETLSEQIATNNATEMVNSFKNKLGDKNEVIEKWISQAKNNFDLTKDLLESLPLNVVANKIEVEDDKIQAKTAQSIMLDIQNKTKNK
jgi:ATP-dependent protease ClpP protease subunit